MEQKAFWRDLAYLVASRLSGRKVVYQVHGGYLPCEFVGGNLLFRGLLRAVLRIPSVVVLLAEAERRAYRAFSPDLRLEVVANAIDVDALTPSVPNALSGRPLRLVYVGRLAEAKGIFDAVHAVARLRSEGINASLAIAGAGPDEQPLRRLIDELQIADRVTLEGALFGVDKNKLWSESDVFVFPTRHREGLPYALLESMVARTVPITCPVGAIPDVIEDKRHGLFVPPNDMRALTSAIRRLHENRTELTQLGEAAHQRVLQSYTVARLADDFRRIYCQI